MRTRDGRKVLTARDLLGVPVINLTLVVISLIAVWALVSATIDNPDRYLPSPWAVGAARRRDRSAPSAARCRCCCGSRPFSRRG